MEPPFCPKGIIYHRQLPAATENHTPASPRKKVS
jgi:hypothetical protein